MVVVHVHYGRGRQCGSSLRLDVGRNKHRKKPDHLLVEPSVRELDTTEASWAHEIARPRSAVTDLDYFRAITVESEQCIIGYDWLSSRFALAAKC